MTTKEGARKPAETSAESFAVGPDDAGARLDKWLSDRSGLTRTRIKALLDGGAIFRGDEAFSDASWKVKAGEGFRIAMPPVAAPEPQGEAIALEIYYEDEDIIIVNKPAGLVVHPAAGNWTGTLVNALIAHCGASLSGIGGVARPGIVHRLDKDTSGLLVAAKNDRAHLTLSGAFAAHDIERAYDAVVAGCPRPGVGTIDAAIARGGADRKKMAALDDADEREDARRAVTHYRVKEAYGRSRARLAGDAIASLVECRLETGRTHQIRVHLAHIGHPVVGDPVYGRGPGLAGLKPGDAAADRALELLSRFRRQALHARVLGFRHPRTGESLRFEAPAPSDMAELIAAFKLL